jgi:uncharacterized protein YukE
MVPSFGSLVPRPTGNLWTDIGLWTTSRPSTARGLPFRPAGTDPAEEEQTVKVDFATLNAMAGQCRSEASDSQAAIQFSDLYEEWRRSAQGVSDALTGMGSLLDSVAASYQQHESEMAARISAMR